MFLLENRIGAILALVIYHESREKENAVLKHKADRTVDCRGTLTPIALLKITHVLREMDTNEELEIIGRDPDTRAKIFKVLPPSSCELIDLECDEEGSQLFRIRLKKIQHFWP